jgi:guanylate kinase
VSKLGGLLKPLSNADFNEHIIEMIVYITGASGSGKTTLLKSLSVKGVVKFNLVNK